MEVAVIGAGAAGLAATYALKKAGVRVVAFEASDAAGGRARCYEKDGFIFDTGAQFLVSMCEAQTRLARELGLGGQILPFNLKVGFWRDGKIYTLPPVGNLPATLRGLPDLFRFRGIPSGAYPQIARVLFQMLKRYINIEPGKMSQPCLLDLGDTSVADFTLRHGGPDALDWVIAPMTAGLTLGEAEEVGIAHLICLLGLHSGLQLMERGIGSLPDALYRYCRDEVRLSTPVRKVVIEKGAVRAVETEDGTLDVDHVICATTAPEALKLMPGLPDSIRRPLETVRYSSTIHVMLAMEKRLLPEGLYAVSLPGSAGSFLPALNECSEKSPYLAPPGAGLSHCVTYGRRAEELWALADRDVTGRVLDEVRRFIPKAPGEPLMAEVVRWREAICLEPPGQFPAIYCMKRHHMNDVRGLHLAGEYMYLISSVEGALRSGEDAAAAVLSSA